MTVTSTWQVEFLDASTTTDLTSNVLGFSIHQNLQIGRFATFGGYMHLDNTGNVFTPSGGGTYQAFTWFNKIVRITCDINDGSSTSTADVAYMVVTDMDFKDDGSYATVMLTLADCYTYAGRDAVTAIDTSAAYGELDAVAQDIVNGVPSGVEAVPFPKFGATNATVSAFAKLNNVDSAETATYPIGYTGIIQEFEDGTARDYISSQILPSGPAVAFPTTATYDSGTAKWTLNAAYINRLLTKETVSGTDHFRTFDMTGDKTADKYPLKNVSTQYNTVDTVNQSQIQAQIPASGSGATFVNDTTSQDTIGIRSVTYNKVIPVVFGGATDTEKAVIGNFWVKRFSTVHFTAQTATLSMSAIDQQMDSSSRQNYADFLSVQTCLFSHAKITFTATGASSEKTYQSVITGRMIHVSPNDTTITLRLATADDNQSLKLDDTNIGLLDTFRLG
jgi:hypothetical protein